MPKQTFEQMSGKLGVAFEASIVPPNGDNVPGARLDAWETTTVHETANTSPGANARMHNQFIRNGGGTEHVSFTFVVDSTRIIQNLPIDQVNYAQGTYKGNHRSISIETCVNSDGDWPTTLQNLAKLLAMLCYLGDKSTDTIVQHWVWYGKNCPTTLRAHPEQWAALIQDTKNYTKVLTGQPTPPPTELTLNGFTVTGGFLELWRKYGLDVMGFPLSAEYKEMVDIPGAGPTEVTFQDWENVVTEWRPGTPARIGAGIRKYKYHK